MGRENTTYSSAELRKICLEAGTDDVGFVDLDRDALQKGREWILHVYPLRHFLL
jgi:hypothetical protein